MLAVLLPVLLQVLAFCCAEETEEKAHFIQANPNLEDLTKMMLELANHYNSTIAELEYRVQELEEDVVAIEEDVEALNTEMEATDERVDVLEYRDIQHDYQFDLVNEDMTDLNEDITNLGNNIEDLGAKTDALEDKDDQHDEQIEDLQTDSASLEDRVEALETAVNAPLTSCESDPCTNGATCIDVNSDTFICLCRDGYFGITCDKSYHDASFQATFSFSSTSDIDSGDTIVFDEVLYNPGNNYNPVFGYYTAPYNGTYQVYYHIYSTDQYGDTRLYLNGERYAYMNHQTYSTYAKSPTELINMQLVEGDYLYIVSSMSPTIYGQDSNGLRSWFGISLISAD